MFGLLKKKMDEERMTRLREIFNIRDLYDHQREAIDSVLDGKDVFLSTATGSGKSICYQALPLITSRNVIVISPLISIMREQTSYLRSVGISSTYIGFDEAENDRIAQGEYSIVYSCPEKLLGEDRWRNMLITCRSKLAAIVVDEAHTVLQWGEAKESVLPFREWFSKIGEIRSLVPDAPLMVLTATASKKNRAAVQKSLCMKSQNTKELCQSPDRPNIKLFVQVVKSNADLSHLFHWIILGLERQRELFPRHLIFTKTIKECACVYNALRYDIPTLRDHYQMFHSCTLERVKQTIISDMNDSEGHIRVLVCTNAAGMGINFQGVSHVVNFGPASDLDTFIQQLGRAGRDGSQSDHLLIFNKRQLNKVEESVKAYATNSTRCRRQFLIQSYSDDFASSLLGHQCCDICSETCTCGCRDDESLSLEFAHMYKSVSDEFDDSSDESSDEFSDDGDQELANINYSVADEVEVNGLMEHFVNMSRD